MGIPCLVHARPFVCVGSYLILLVIASTLQVEVNHSLTLLMLELLGFVRLHLRRGTQRRIGWLIDIRWHYFPVFISAFIFSKTCRCIDCLLTRVSIFFKPDGWVNCSVDQTDGFVPWLFDVFSMCFTSFNVSMFQRFQCFDVSMFSTFPHHAFQCFNVSMFQCFL